MKRKEGKKRQSKDRKEETEMERRGQNHAELQHSSEDSAPSQEEQNGIKGGGEELK